MSDKISYLNFQINVLWFALIFIILAGFGWLRILSKKVKDTAKQLEELKNKTVVNEVNLDLQKRRKK